MTMSQLSNRYHNSDNYKSINNVPIISAATARQSLHTGQVYILVFNEALWVDNHMEHSLINPNQLRCYGTKVQDDRTLHRTLLIITEDNEFCMELYMKSTIVYTDTFTPSSQELEQCPQIELLSSRPWDPNHVKFPEATTTLEDEVSNL